jgi:hypothetical protein
MTARMKSIGRVPCDHIHTLQSMRQQRGRICCIFLRVYLTCTDDHAIPEFAQKDTIDIAKAAGAKMEVVSRAVGRTPYQFQPDLFADFVEEYARNM